MDNMRDGCYNAKMMEVCFKKSKGILQFGNSVLTREKGGILDFKVDPGKSESMISQLQREFEEHKDRTAKSLKLKKAFTKNSNIDNYQPEPTQTQYSAQAATAVPE